MTIPYSLIYVLMIDDKHPSFAVHSERVAQAKVAELNADAQEAGLELRWRYFQVPLVAPGKEAAIP